MPADECIGPTAGRFIGADTRDPLHRRRVGTEPDPHAVSRASLPASSRFRAAEVSATWGPSEQSASADEQTAALGGLEPRGVAGLARGLLAENLAVQLH
jgi:hypothetical protein